MCLVPNFEIFFPLLLFGDGCCVLAKEIVFSYEIFAVFVYMEEMSTPQPTGGLVSV